ncbi:MAG TPA: ComF family protein [Abditibacterium sp.]
MELSASLSKAAHLRLQNLLLDALFPPRCCGCAEWSRMPFCARCQPKLRPLKPPFCECCATFFDPLSFPAALCASCREKAPGFRAARSAFLFEGPVRHAIHRFKYAEKSALAARLAPFLVEIWRGDPILSAFLPDYLVPVPLHPSRHRKRGFNQSFLLARELGRSEGVPVALLLRRTRATAPQVDLDRPARAKNVRDAFAVAPDVAKRAQSLRGARVLLIDDVFTTGATLGECARALRKAGASEVCALTLARQV